MSRVEKMKRICPVCARTYLARSYGAAGRALTCSRECSCARRRGQLRERFERCFEKTAGCWEWRRALKDGYGHLNIVGRGSVGSHRIAYEFYVGEIGEGLCVCHHCDNRRCVNPDHLFLGTIADNVADMIRKGRKVILRGGEHPKMRVDHECAREVLRLIRSGRSQVSIARQFGLGNSVVCQINRGTHWTARA